MGNFCLFLAKNLFSLTERYCGYFLDLLINFRAAVKLIVAVLWLSLFPLDGVVHYYLYFRSKKVTKSLLSFQISFPTVSSLQPTFLN